MANATEKLYFIAREWLIGLVGGSLISWFLLCSRLFKGVLTLIFETDFTLPYNPPVYRDSSEQMWGSGNAYKVFFDIKGNFHMAHLLISTLTWSEVQFWWLHEPVWLVVETSETKKYKMAACVSWTEPQSGVAMETSWYLARARDKKLVLCCDVRVQ